MSSIHCVNNAKDRSLGQFWEFEFCKMARNCGKAFTPHQFRCDGAASAYSGIGLLKKRFFLPDATIWTYPGEHHEIKHKEPTRFGCYGLEKYRLDALYWFAKETKQAVYYTIHDHQKAGGRDVRINNINHWVTCSVEALFHANKGPVKMDSWVGGRKQCVPGYYWPASLWTPLAELWRNAAPADDVCAEEEHNLGCL